jgi:hypothetical protein
MELRHIRSISCSRVNTDLARSIGDDHRGFACLPATMLALACCRGRSLKSIVAAGQPGRATGQGNRAARPGSATGACNRDVQPGRATGACDRDSFCPRESKRKTSTRGVQLARRLREASCKSFDKKLRPLRALPGGLCMKTVPRRCRQPVEPGTTRRCCEHIPK